MKKSLLIVSALLLLIHTMHAQCMLQPIALSQKINQSTLIIEGQVVNKHCEQDETSKNIYTIYDIAITQLLKGVAADSIVQVAEMGGVLGTQMDVVTNALQLNKGNAGIYFLKPTAVFNNNYFEPYAGVQGVLQYDPVAHAAHEPFNIYKNIKINVLDVIQNKTGLAPVSFKPLNWAAVAAINQEKDNAIIHAEEILQLSMSNALQSANSSTITVGGGTLAGISTSATITSFSPASISAGNFKLLTINGSGFGATQGTGYVGFENANDGGASYIQPIASLYKSWSDTKIEVYVPTGAGTGAIIVGDGVTNKLSPASLTIDYNISNLKFLNGVDSNYIAKHVDKNTLGGYNLRYNTSFAANNAASADVTASLNNWACVTGINWRRGADTSLSVVAADGVNIVTFDITNPLPIGTLGTAVSRYNGCSSGGSFYWRVNEIDVHFNSTTNWYYGTSGTPTLAQYDFYSVCIHELGHAHQLGHVIDPVKVMHYSLFNGATSRLISPVEELAGDFVVTNDTTLPATCGQLIHKYYACTPNVSLTLNATSVSESNFTGTLTATLDGVNSLPTVVNIALSGTATNGTDFTMATTTITVPAYTSNASITFNIVSDALFEPNETIFFDISSVTNGLENGIQQQTFTILNDDAPPTVSINIAPLNVAENTLSITQITATLNSLSLLPTTVNLSYSGNAAPTVDFNGDASIVIPAGSLSATGSITMIDDAIFEGNEKLLIDVASVVNATENGVQIDSLEITDDETIPQITISSNATAVAENGGTYTVTAVATNASTLPITISLNSIGTAVNATDFSISSATITITAGSLSATSIINIIDDAIYEGAENIELEINSVTNGAENGIQFVTTTINDDETIPQVSLSINNNSIPELNGTASLTATLTNASAFAITVNVQANGTAINGTDYNLGGATINIPANALSASNTITTINDGTDEDDETIDITIASATGATVVSSTNVITIVDDDAAPTLNLNWQNANTNEDGGVAFLQFALSAASGKSVSASYNVTGTATNNTDYTYTSTTINFTPGSVLQTVSFTCNNDSIKENTETIIANIASSSNATIGTNNLATNVIDNDSVWIQIKNGTTILKNNDTIDFGNITVNGNVNKTLNIKNVGSALLNISGFAASNSGNVITDVNAVFAGTMLTPLVSGNYNFEFATSNCGANQFATISFFNNASNSSNPYVLTFKATPVDATAPVPNITSLAAVIANCNATITAPTATDFCEGTITATTTDPLTYTSNGTYTINWEYKDATNNIATQTQTVSIQNNIVASVASIVNSCNGANGIVAITATGGSGTYIGTGNINAPIGTQVFNVTDNINGCAASASATVVNAISTVLSVANNDNKYCASNKDTITLIATTTAVAPVVFNWTTSGAVNISNAIINNAQLSGSTAGAFKAYYTATSGGCTVVDSANIQALSTQTIVVSSNANLISNVTCVDYEACNGTPITITVTGVDVLNAPPLLPINTLFNIDATYNGTYTFSGHSLNGCPANNNADSTICISLLSNNTSALPLNSEIVGNYGYSLGNICATATLADGQQINMTTSATNCGLLCNINDDADGISLGNFEACVYEDAMPYFYNNYLYLPRYFNLTPTNQGGAQLRFYFLHSDFLRYNTEALNIGLPIINADTNIGYAAFNITQVHGGLFSAINNTSTEHTVVANWDATNKYWDAVINVSGFSGFYAHAPSAPLSVAALVLEGAILPTTNLLSWRHTLPNNVVSFQLLAGATANNMSMIFESPQLKNYEDANYYNHNYYKVIAKTFDGNSIESNILQLKRAYNNTISIFPNPATAILNVQVNAITESNNAKLSIYDITGKCVLAKNINILNGTNNLNINIANLAKGFYHLEILMPNNLKQIVQFNKQ